ncbi:MAG: lipoyl(octanoyl) transferase LipB [Vampirovibrionales bacterium]|jgi:lipoyl(octanoyl) transferase|nr:lipoyl(octanoyl) transferase LipB [Vampirovibrionales bacterium]
MYRNLCNKFVKHPDLKTVVWILPCLDFEIVHELQKKILQDKIANAAFPDVLLLTSHPACYTLGRASSQIEKEHHYPFPVFEIERGGHLTFHHPEQVILYPLITLKTPDVHAHLKRVLNWGQNALAHLGIDSLLDGQGSGLWLDESKKVASVGIAIKRWVSYHGLAINVSVDESMWQGLPTGVHPCALPHAVPTNLCDIRPALIRQEVELALIEVLKEDERLHPIQFENILSFDCTSIK